MIGGECNMVDDDGREVAAVSVEFSDVALIRVTWRQQRFLELFGAIDEKRQAMILAYMEELEKVFPARTARVIEFPLSVTGVLKQQLPKAQS